MFLEPVRKLAVNPWLFAVFLFGLSEFLPDFEDFVLFIYMRLLKIEEFVFYLPVNLKGGKLFHRNFWKQKFLLFCSVVSWNSHSEFNRSAKSDIWQPLTNSSWAFLNSGWIQEYPERMEFIDAWGEMHAPPTNTSAKAHLVRQVF